MLKYSIESESYRSKTLSKDSIQRDAILRVHNKIKLKYLNLKNNQLEKKIEESMVGIDELAHP